MIDREERIILEALRRSLSAELAVFRQMLALATRKREALVANELEDLHRIIAEEEALSKQEVDQRRIRGDLIRRLAEWRKLGRHHVL